MQNNYKDTQNIYKVTQNDYKETQSHYSVLLLCRRAGGPFYVPVSRGPLSHNKSMAAVFININSWILNVLSLAFIYYTAQTM